MNCVFVCLQCFVMENVYNELYMVQLTCQQRLVDQHGVVTKHNAVRQMVTPPVPRLPFSVNRELEWISCLGISLLLFGVMVYFYCTDPTRNNP